MQSQVVLKSPQETMRTDLLSAAPTFGDRTAQGGSQISTDGLPGGIKQAVNDKFGCLSPCNRFRQPQGHLVRCGVYIPLKVTNARENGRRFSKELASPVTKVHAEPVGKCKAPGIMLKTESGRRLFLLVPGTPPGRGPFSSADGANFAWRSSRASLSLSALVGLAEMKGVNPLDMNGVNP
jgi:hypothetical protein